MNVSVKRTQDREVKISFTVEAEFDADNAAQREDACRKLAAMIRAALPPDEVQGVIDDLQAAVAKVTRDGKRSCAQRRILKEFAG